MLWVEMTAVEMSAVELSGVEMSGVIIFIPPKDFSYTVFIFIKLLQILKLAQI